MLQQHECITQVGFVKGARLDFVDIGYGVDLGFFFENGWTWAIVELLFDCTRLVFVGLLLGQTLFCWAIVGT